MYNISAIIPAFSDISILYNSVLSIARQYTNNDFNIELIIVNDNAEKKGQYDYFLSKDFEKLKNKNVSIKIIENKKNLGQGQSRQKGIDAAQNNFFVLCDEDDIYSPNALFRLWEILNKEHETDEQNHKVGLIAAPIYAFDKNSYTQIIPSNSIWVNAKLYNKEFLKKHYIRFPSGENSHRAEDYPFVRCLDYALAHDNKYKRIDINDNEQTYYLWFPNPNSRSRQSKFYGSLLAGYTMQSSIIIYDYMQNFAEKNNILEQEDEYLKQEILNMSVYSFYNYLYFLFDLSQGWDCKAEYWNAVKTGLNGLKERIKPYWHEYVYSDIVKAQYLVKNNSDLRFIESWQGKFEDFVEKDCLYLQCNFEQIKQYAKTLKFDGAMHEINAQYVQAWKKRHEKKIDCF